MGLFDKVKKFLNATEESMSRNLMTATMLLPDRRLLFRDEFQFGTPASAP
jgi:hypothetical protein